MNIQIFGSKKSNDSKKAERWFKERRIKYQYIDLYAKGLSLGEYRTRETPRLGAFKPHLPVISNEERRQENPYPHGDREALLDYIRDSDWVHFTDTTRLQQPVPRLATLPVSTATTVKSIFQVTRKSP